MSIIIACAIDLYRLIGQIRFIWTDTEQFLYLQARHERLEPVWSRRAIALCFGSRRGWKLELTWIKRLGGGGKDGCTDKDGRHRGGGIGHEDLARVITD